MLLNLLLVIEVIVALFLVVVVLLQRSEGGGLVSGGTGSLMSVRGAGDLMTRITWILGSLFFIISLLLTVLAGREKGASSVVDRLKIDALDPTTLNQPRAGQPPAGTAQPGAPGSAPAPLQAPTPQVNNPFLGDEAAPATTAPAPAAPPQK
jgi:preprotein translocase subunit SecG